MTAWLSRAYWPERLRLSLETGAGVRAEGPRDASAHQLALWVRQCLSRRMRRGGL